MSPLPASIIALFDHFAPVFSTQVWPLALTLVLGAILAPGKRTVTSALRSMGLADEQHFINYHRVLSRATWSALGLSRILLGLLVTLLLAAGVPLIVIIDDTLERRRGKRIQAVGVFRDGVRSTAKHKVTSFGLRWVCMALLVPVPWAARPWALPFLTVLAPAPAQARGRHKTCIDWAVQLVGVVHRWFPQRQLIVLADGGYASHKLARACQRWGHTAARLVTRLVLTAQLYDPPPVVPLRRAGRKAQKGLRQPKLCERLKDPQTVWTEQTLPWYGGQPREVQLASGTALWHQDGAPPIPIRWVLVRDVHAAWKPQAFLCTDLTATPEQVVRWFIQRWNIEVTFEEVRAHLGVETQRQWSDRAIARTTPILFGLFSLVVLLTQTLTQGQAMPVRQSAWYHKSEATFADCLAYVRRALWQALYCAKSTSQPELAFGNRDAITPLLDILCYPE